MDRDTAANIDRLTAQVATLKREVDQYEAQLQLERREGRSLALMYDRQNEKLQESLTACEQERDDFKRIVEVWRKRHGGAEDRVRILESALREVVRWGDKLSWSIMSDACGWIYGIAKDALTPAPPAASHTIDCNEGMTYGDSCSCAPPAETPAPSDKDEWTGVNLDPVAHKLAIIGDRDKEIDRLRAAFAAANEEIARLHASMKLIRDAAKQALDDRDITTAKLGRAVAALREARLWFRRYDSDAVRLPGEPEGRSLSHEQMRALIDPILADADGKGAAEACAAEREVIDAAKAFRASGVPHEHWVRLWTTSNEEIERLRAEVAQLRAEPDEWAKECEAHAATTAKLGRAVAFLMKRNYSSPTNNHESFDWYRERDAILADADGTQSAAYVSEMEAVYEAAGQVRRYWGSALGATSEQAALIEALAAVDARRGGGR
jgi:CRISPR/Cas system-associated endoribonuclease Cas2